MPTRRDPELSPKKKATLGSQKSNKGRPGSAIADTALSLLEEDVINIPTIEENSSTPQQVH
jgi:hypothetical protein